MLQSLMKERNITTYKLSKNTGIPYSTLSNLISGKTDIQAVSAGILFKLSKELDVSMEQLYLGKDEKRIIYLNNEERNVHLHISGNDFSYLGPKNLVGFRNIVKVLCNVIYVDTFFVHRGKIITEEDYIDLNEICGEKKDLLDRPYEVIIGTPGESRREFLMNNALMVSDGMAVLSFDNGTKDCVVEVTNLKRNRERMQIRLKDYAVLYSNMGNKMAQRAIDTVKRNAEIILWEEKERKHAEIHE